MYIKCLIANKVTLIPVLMVLVSLLFPSPVNLILLLSGLYSFAVLGNVGYPTYSNYKIYLHLKTNSTNEELVNRFSNISSKYYCHKVGIRIAQYEFKNKKPIPWMKVIFFI